MPGLPIAIALLVSVAPAQLAAQDRVARMSAHPAGIKTLLPPTRTVRVRPATPQSERERKVSACRAAKGAWQVEARGVSLTAKGSDVDEIYGRIYVTSTSGGVFRSQRGGTGWSRNYLWASEKNVDLGANPKISFPRLQITDIRGAERHNAKVRVHFDLRDEDDGRGGRNDEYFVAYGPVGSRAGAGNSVEYTYLIPDCDEQPEFRRGFQEMMFGTPQGQGEKNKITFIFTLAAFRAFP